MERLRVVARREFDDRVCCDRAVAEFGHLADSVVLEVALGAVIGALVLLFVIGLFNKK